MLAASVVPAPSARRISWPDLPVLSETTDASLLVAPSQVFCSRFPSATRSSRSAVRERVSSRRSRGGRGGMKLARSKP